MTRVERLVASVVCGVLGGVLVATVLSSTVQAQDITSLLTRFLSGLRSGYVVYPPVLFGALPACGATTQGASAFVTDSSTVTWGATVTGSSTNAVGVSCNGTNWTVASK